MVPATGGAAQEPPSPPNATAGAPQRERAAEATHPEYDRRQVVPFLDATYVALGRARPKLAGEPLKSEITFDADIVPNFVVRQTFFDVLAEEDLAVNARGVQEPEYRFAWSVVGVPMVRIRMFVNDISSPVRTPSFMPKGTFQAFWFKLGRNERVNLLAAQATLGHHSNGQDGCLYRGQSRNEAVLKQPCEPEVAADGSFVPVNRDDGSFSTNYLQFGFRYRNIVLDPLKSVSDDGRLPDRTSKRDATLGLDVELNPTEFLGAGINEDLRSRYGGTRLTALGGMAWRVKGCNRLEAKGFMKRIFGTGAEIPSWAGSAEVQCLVGKTNWGPFVRYFAGQDYYNLAFQDSVQRLQFGVTYSQEGFLRFRLHPRGDTDQAAKVAARRPK